MDVTETLEKYRLFIALPVPEPVKAEMERAQRRLREAVPEKCVRWTTREQFHLTLKFLGSVSSGRVDAFIKSVAGAINDVPPLEMCATRVGFFPNARRPRVIWVGVHDAQGLLAKLQLKVEVAVRDFTNEKADGRFTGHVTLGRAREVGRRDAEALSRIAAQMAETLLGKWQADRIEIMRSQLSPRGATHACLAAIPLGIPGGA